MEGLCCTCEIGCSHAASSRCGLLLWLLLQEAPLAPFFLPTVATASTLAFVAPTETKTVPAAGGAGDDKAVAATLPAAWSDDDDDDEDGSDGGDDDGDDEGAGAGRSSRVLKVEGPLRAGSKLLKGKVFQSPRSTLGKVRTAVPLLQTRSWNCCPCPCHSNVTVWSCSVHACSVHG